MKSLGLPLRRTTAQSAPPVTLLVADDHPVYRDGLVHAVGDDPRLELVAAVGDGLAALTAGVELEPDVALLDLRMPGLDGIAVCRRLTGHDPPLRTRVILLSAYHDPSLAELAAEAGAAAYLSKDSPRAALCQAVLDIADEGG